MKKHTFLHTYQEDADTELEERLKGYGFSVIEIDELLSSTAASDEKYAKINTITAFYGKGPYARELLPAHLLSILLKNKQGIEALNYFCEHWDELSNKIKRVEIDNIISNKNPLNWLQKVPLQANSLKAKNPRSSTSAEQESFEPAGKKPRTDPSFSFMAQPNSLAQMDDGVASLKLDSLINSIAPKLNDLENIKDKAVQESQLNTFICQCADSLEKQKNSDVLLTKQMKKRAMQAVSRIFKAKADEEAGKAGGRADEPPIDAKGGVEPFVGAAAEAADAGRPGEKESLPPFGEGNGDSDVPFPISPVAAPGKGYDYFTKVKELLQVQEIGSGRGGKRAKKSDYSPEQKKYYAAELVRLFAKHIRKTAGDTSLRDRDRDIDSGAETDEDAANVEIKTIAKKAKTSRSSTSVEQESLEPVRKKVRRDPSFSFMSQPNSLAQMDDDDNLWEPAVAVYDPDPDPSEEEQEERCNISNYNPSYPSFSGNDGRDSCYLSNMASEKAISLTEAATKWVATTALSQAPINFTEAQAGQLAACFIFNGHPDSKLERLDMLILQLKMVWPTITFEQVFWLANSRNPDKIFRYLARNQAKLSEYFSITDLTAIGSNDGYFSLVSICEMTPLLLKKNFSVLEIRTLALRYPGYKSALLKIINNYYDQLKEKLKDAFNSVLFDKYPTDYAYCFPKRLLIFCLYNNNPLAKTLFKNEEAIKEFFKKPLRKIYSSIADLTGDWVENIESEITGAMRAMELSDFNPEENHETMNKEDWMEEMIQIESEPLPDLLKINKFQGREEDAKKYFIEINQTLLKIFNQFKPYSVKGYSGEIYRDDFREIVYKRIFEENDVQEIIDFLTEQEKRDANQQFSAKQLFQLIDTPSKTKVLKELRGNMDKLFAIFPNPEDLTQIGKWPVGLYNLKTLRIYHAEFEKLNLGKAEILRIIGNPTGHRNAKTLLYYYNQLEGIGMKRDDIISLASTMSGGNVMIAIALYYRYIGKSFSLEEIVALCRGEACHKILEKIFKESEWRLDVDLMGKEIKSTFKKIEQAFLSPLESGIIALEEACEAEGRTGDPGAATVDIENGASKSPFSSPKGGSDSFFPDRLASAAAAADPTNGSTPPAASIGGSSARPPISAAINPSQTMMDNSGTTNPVSYSEPPNLWGYNAVGFTENSFDENYNNPIFDGAELFGGEAADAGRSGQNESLPPSREENEDLDMPFCISTVAAPSLSSSAHMIPEDNPVPSDFFETLNAPISPVSAAINPSQTMMDNSGTTNPVFYSALPNHWNYNRMESSGDPAYENDNNPFR